MVLKITAINHLRAVFYSLCALSLIIGGAFILRQDMETIWVGILFYSVFLLPSLFLHLQYFIKNRGQVIEILDTELIVKNRVKEKVVIKFSDIKKITLFKSASLDKGGIQMSPLESYHYAQLMLKNGESIFITNLLTPDVERAVSLIKWAPYERRKGLFLPLGSATCTF